VCTHEHTTGSNVFVRAKRKLNLRFRVQTHRNFYACVQIYILVNFFMHAHRNVLLMHVCIYLYAYTYTYIYMHAYMHASIAECTAELYLAPTAEKIEGRNVEATNATARRDPLLNT